MDDLYNYHIYKETGLYGNDLTEEEQKKVRGLLDRIYDTMIKEDFDIMMIKSFNHRLLLKVEYSAAKTPLSLING